MVRLLFAGVVQPIPAAAVIVGAPGPVIVKSLPSEAMEEHLINSEVETIIVLFQLFTAGVTRVG